MVVSRNLPCNSVCTSPQKCSRSVTTSVSHHPGKTMSSVIFQLTWKVFTWRLLRDKWKTRMDKSIVVVIWTNSWIWVPHPWISTWSLSKGKSSLKLACKSNRRTDLTQTCVDDTGNSRCTFPVTNQVSQLSSHLWSSHSFFHSSSSFWTIRMEKKFPEKQKSSQIFTM
jgi:hypothetical protein